MGCAPDQLFNWLLEHLSLDVLEVPHREPADLFLISSHGFIKPSKLKIAIILFSSSSLLFYLKKNLLICETFNF